MINLNTMTLLKPDSLRNLSEEEAGLLSVVATRRKNLQFHFYDQDYRLTLQLINQRFTRSLHNYLILEAKIDGQKFTAYTSQDSLFNLLASHFNNADLSASSHQVWVTAAEAMVEELVIYLREKYRTNLQMTKLQPTDKGALTFIPSQKSEPNAEQLCQVLMTSRDFAADLLLVIPPDAVTAFTKLLASCWLPVPLRSKLAAQRQLLNPRLLDL